MNWTRVKPGEYVAGPYRIERQPYHRAIWIADGPGIADSSGVHDLKEDAQAECEEAAIMRIAGAEATVQPVVGDLARVIATDRRGQVSSIMPSDNGRPLICLRFARGRRLCLFREEIEVMLP